MFSMDKSPRQLTRLSSTTYFAAGDLKLVEARRIVSFNAPRVQNVDLRR